MKRFFISFLLCFTLSTAWNPLFYQIASASDVPQNLQQLWQNFEEMDKKTPLEVEVLKEWQQDDVVCRIMRYQVGIFKGSPSKVAAFYAFPKGGKNLPAILEMHGGGQSASLNSVVTFAKRGYACISLNWGGNKMNIGQETWAGPQTDWGKLDATHPPQRNKANHFAGSLAPDEFTLDAVESPRNSNWFLVLTAGRGHHPAVFTWWFAGAGVKGGNVHGKSDATGNHVQEKPVTMPDCNATIAQAMGIDLGQIEHSPSGRPFTIADKGKPVVELFA